MLTKRPAFFSVESERTVRKPCIACLAQAMDVHRAAVILQAFERGRVTRWRLRSPIVQAAARAGLWPPGLYLRNKTI